MRSANRTTDELTILVENNWDAAISNSTRRTYTTAIQCFLKFFVMYFSVSGLTLQNLPCINEDVIIRFVTHCQHALKLRFDTIKLYLAGIRFHYLRQGHADPLVGTDRLQIILRGIKRSQNNIRKVRLPITSFILKQLCDLLDKGFMSPQIDLMLQCIFKVAFYGFLRCGEFTCNANESMFLRMRDINVDVENAFFTLNLPCSKTDPFRQGVLITIHENAVLRPVHTMRQYLDMRYKFAASAFSPLFTDNFHDGIALTRDKFLSHLNSLLQILGYPDGQFSGHSFRIGAATSAAAAGVEDHVIKTLGRWSSDCYLRYIRTDAEVVRNAQVKMSC